VQGVALSHQAGRRPRAGSREGSPPARLAAPPPLRLGHGRGQRGEEETEETPPVRRDQRGRGRCVKEREVPRGFLQIDLVRFLSNG
jgi:hypothetical protein